MKERAVIARRKYNATGSAWLSALSWPEAREALAALPVGNGRIGAMVFGGTDAERIQFNEATLWVGGPRDYSHTGASKIGFPRWFDSSRRSGSLQISRRVYTPPPRILEAVDPDQRRRRASR